MKDSEIAAKSGLTVPGVRWKRQKGWTDEEIISGQRAVEGETLVAAQLRKEIALADTREIERDEKQGTLIPLAEAQRAWSMLIQTTRTKFTALPTALAAQLAAYTDAGEIRELLTKDIDRRLEQLAEEFQQAARGALDDGGEGDKATGTADGDGVGGETPDTQ